MRNRFLTFMLVLCSFCTMTSAQKVELTNRTKVGTDPMGDTPGKFGSINGKSHQNDAVITHKGWQYTAYYNDQSPRKIVLARRKLTSTKWEKFVYSGYSQTTNDGHNVISLGKAPHDGTLHLSFDHHVSDLNYLVSKKGLLDNPAGKSWNNSQFGQVADNLGFGKLKSITYPIFATAPNGNLYLSRRDGNPWEGDQILYEYKNSKWVNIGKYIEGNKNNPYMDNLYIDRYGRMHAAWIWRSGRLDTARDICYAYSDDYGRNWFDSKDKKVGTTNNGAMSHNDDPSLTAVPLENAGLINQEGMTADAKGRPHVVHRVGNRIHHFYQDDDNKWHNINTNIPSSGRASIIADNQNNVYITFSDLKIARATEEGNYQDWKIVNDELAGEFTGDALVDRYRMIEDGVLSIYMLSKNYNSCDVMDFDIGIPQTSGPEGTYLFKNKATGNYMDSDGSTINAKAKTGNPDQRWAVVKSSGANFNIDNQHSGRGVLDADAGTVVKGSNTAPPSTANDKEWTVEFLGGNTYRFKNVAYGGFLAENTSSHIVEHTGWNGFRSQWILERVTESNNLTARLTAPYIEPKMTVYPNPVVNGAFNVDLKGVPSSKVAVYDMRGALIYEGEATNGSIQVLTEKGFTTGMYLIEATDGEGQVYTQKIIVE